MGLWHLRNTWERQMDEWRLWNKICHPGVVILTFSLSLSLSLRFFLSFPSLPFLSCLLACFIFLFPRVSFPSVYQPKNLELRDILGIGLNFLTFLKESEKPEEGTQCSLFLYKGKCRGFIFFSLQQHTIRLVEEPQCHLGSMGSSFPVCC